MNPEPSPLPSGEGRGEGSASLDFPPEQDAETEWFGAIIALGAWTMFFAALVFAVGYLRLREPWPSAGTLAPPLLLPGLGVFLLACGSGLVHRAHGRVRAEPSAPGTTTGWLLAGVIVLGIAFLALQAFLASSFWQKGLRLPSGGSHASAFYGLMAVHAVHVAVGLLGLTRVAVGLARGTDVRQRLRLWNLYWHFVTMTGLLFFGAVYLP